MNSRICAAWLVSVLACLLSACGDGEPTKVLDGVRQRGVLRVAMEPTFPPFEYLESGTLVGFDVDLARELAASLDVDVEFVRVEWAGIIPSLQTGKADLIISGMTATPERAKQVAYSEPYFRTITCLLVSKQRISDVKSAADLNRPDRRVVVKLGTTGASAARESCPRANIVALPEDATAAAEVANSSADALLFDIRQVRLHHERYPEKTFVLADAVTSEPYGIACRLGEDECLAWLNETLAELRSRGWLKEHYAKYGLESADG